MPGFTKPAVGAPFDPEPKRELMRGTLALLLIFLLAVEVGFGFLMIYLETNETHYVENMRSLMDVVFGATVTLVGTALGFYFGQRSAEQAAGKSRG